MTTEDDFQRQLDADPDDHHTRLVLADWLEERGDPGAAGYRALGANRLRPDECGYARCPWIWGNSKTLGDSDHLGSRPHAKMDPEWWAHLSHDVRSESSGYWKYYPTRRGAEDAAARAFAQLPAARRAELLATSPGG